MNHDMLLELLAQHAYAAVLALLILCGIGLPLPEEAILIGSGWSIFKSQSGDAGLILMIVTATVAILLGDSLTFWLGNYFGPDILKARFMRRLISPKRIHKAHLAFEKHGWKAVFFARFVAGVRIATYFIAGTLRMRWGVFLLLDLLGCLITVPVSIWFGWRFGAKIEEVFLWSHRFRDIVGVVLVLVGLVWLLIWLRRRRAAEPLAVDQVIDEVRASNLKPPGKRVADDQQG